jgi:competence protein ComEA
VSRVWVGAAALVASGLIGVVLLWPTPATLPAIELAPPRTTSGIVTVHVSGAIARPGLVSVDRNARVAEVIVAAGGALPEADLSAMNLASPVVDGQQLIVPGPGAVPGVGSDGGTLVRINTADATAIESLPGVGPVLAERIVAHREQHGPFQAVEDLLDVPGIGEAKLAALRDRVMVP